MTLWDQLVLLNGATSYFFLLLLLVTLLSFAMFLATFYSASCCFCWLPHVLLSTHTNSCSHCSLFWLTTRALLRSCMSPTIKVISSTNNWPHPTVDGGFSNSSSCLSVGKKILNSFFYLIPYTKSTVLFFFFLSSNLY